MRAAHFIRLFLVVAWQAAMVACLIYFDSAKSHRWILDVVAVAALLLPFIGYIASVYDAPIFARWPRAIKAGVFTLGSFVLTFGGYLAFFLAGDSFRARL
jgi:hypothetical protein